VLKFKLLAKRFLQYWDTKIRNNNKKMVQNFYQYLTSLKITFIYKAIFNEFVILYRLLIIYFDIEFTINFFPQRNSFVLCIF